MHIYKQGMEPEIGNYIGAEIQHYDKDGDGKLNEEERAAFEKARQQRGRGATGSTISYHSPG